MTKQINTQPLILTLGMKDDYDDYETLSPVNSLSHLLYHSQSPITHLHLDKREILSSEIKNRKIISQPSQYIGPLDLFLMKIQMVKERQSSCKDRDDKEQPKPSSSSIRNIIRKNSPELKNITRIPTICQETNISYRRSIPSLTRHSEKYSKKYQSTKQKQHDLQDKVSRSRRKKKQLPKIFLELKLDASPQKQVFPPRLSVDMTKPVLNTRKPSITSKRNNVEKIISDLLSKKKKLKVGILTSHK